MLIERKQCFSSSFFPCSSPSSFSLTTLLEDFHYVLLAYYSNNINQCIFFYLSKNRFKFLFVAWMRIVELEFKSHLRFFVCLLNKAYESYSFVTVGRKKKSKPKHGRCILLWLVKTSGRFNLFIRIIIQDSITALSIYFFCCPLNFLFNPI